MREFSNHAVLSMSDSTMAVSSKYTQDLSVQIVFFTFSCKWFLCFYFWAVIWSYIVDLFAALHELASASAHITKARIIGARALKTLWRHLKKRSGAKLAGSRSKYGKPRSEYSVLLHNHNFNPWFNFAFAAFVYFTLYKPRGIPQ